MTILFLVRRFYPLIGGVEKHVLEVGKILIKKGYKVIVITENSEALDLKIFENVNGIEVLRISVGKEDKFKKFRIWSDLWKLRYIFKEADIVHCHDVFFWYLPFNFIYPGKKVYTTFHGYESFPVRKKAVWVRKISEILSKGNICIGDFIKKWYGTKPNYVSYGGVNQSSSPELRDNNSKRKVKIVLIGRLEKDIGIKTYLKSLEELKIRKIKFNLQVYGKGIFERKMGKYGNVNGFTKNVSSALEAADIVLCSSYLLIIQALILRKIIIAVYENPLKEDYLRMSPFANYIYICKSADEVSRVVEYVTSNPWKSSTMIEEGFRWAKQQTWESVTDKYLKLWKI